MTTWTSDELTRVGNAEELQIASRRRDGTLRNPVTIWVVRVGGDLYVRSVNGRSKGSWFLGTLSRHEGHVRAGGVDKDVTFVEIESSDALSDQIDAAYRAKYRRYSDNIVNGVINPASRAATLKLVPR